MPNALDSIQGKKGRQKRGKGEERVRKEGSEGGRREYCLSLAWFLYNLSSLEVYAISHKWKNSTPDFI